MGVQVFEGERPAASRSRHLGVLMLTEVERPNRLGPVLRDGTRLLDLIDLDARAVSMRVLIDPEIHQLEMDRVFARAWTGLAHESEIPNPGDFVLRAIGEDGVIVTRDRDGGINVLLNACSHRGMEVCWGDRGNSSSFKCPYHGWSFDNTGKLLGAPYEQKVYGDWDKSLYPLETARVAVRHGAIFATFGKDTPSFEDYMGDFMWYFDNTLGGCEWEPLGPPTRTLWKGNWKIQADQFSGDAYHGTTLHSGFVELGLPDPASQLDNVKVSIPGTGHFSWTLVPGLTARMREGAADTSALPGGVVVDIDRKLHGTDNFINFAFPATTINGQGAEILRDWTGTDPNIGRRALIGQLAPVGVGNFENWEVLLVAKGTPEEMKKQMRAMTTLTAVIAADDSQQMESMQRVAVGSVGRRQTMKHFSTIGEPTERTGLMANWEGPGDLYAGVSRDDTQWIFWKHWFDVMTSDVA